MQDKINKEDIIKYGYYDDSNKYIVVLNEEKLKEIFEADSVIFDEIYR